MYIYSTLKSKSGNKNVTREKKTQQELKAPSSSLVKIRMTSTTAHKPQLYLSPVKTVNSLPH